MNLNEITANIRLRSTWEAIDLGFAMVQHWWKAIYVPLAIVTFTLAIFLYLIVPYENIWIASLVFWWLKPLYDRIVLHVISHKLFNNDVSSWQTIKAIPSLMWNTGFFQTLTFRRLSLSRGFNLPIWQLEQLRGVPRSQRQTILHTAAHSQAVWLTIAMIHLEIFLLLSAFVLVILFLPQNMVGTFFEGLFNSDVDYEKGINVANYIFYVGVVTFLHPFYIAGSFALYTNRRTQLEAWDIELDFRKLSKRLKTVSQNILSLFIIGFSISFLFSPDLSYATDTTDTDEIEFISTSRHEANKSKEIIEEVMKTKNLDDKKKVKRWVKKKKEEKEKEKRKDFDNSLLKDFFEPFAKGFAFILEFGLWILIAIGILLLIVYRERWLYLFNAETKKSSSYEAPDIMFGMDVRPESLPDDITGEARKLWENAQIREALSLLYRGALIRLINKE